MIRLGIYLIFLSDPHCKDSCLVEFLIGPWDWYTCFIVLKVKQTVSKLYRSDLVDIMQARDDSYVASKQITWDDEVSMIINMIKS